MPKQVVATAKKTPRKAKRTIRSGTAPVPTRFKRVSKNRIQRVVDRWIQVLKPQKIVLFGSYAYGKPNADSDVDMLIIMDSNERPTTRVVRALEAVHGVKNFAMDILVRTPDEILQRLKIGDFFVQEILERGKVLYERGAIQRMD